MKNARAEEGSRTMRADAAGSASGRGGNRLLLDAYGDSLKNVALMLWKSGYGMHQRKVRLPPKSPAKSVALATPLFHAS